MGPRSYAEILKREGTKVLNTERARIALYAVFNQIFVNLGPAPSQEGQYHVQTDSRKI